jgi:hypothetical protein
VIVCGIRVLLITGDNIFKQKNGGFVMRRFFVYFMVVVFVMVGMVGCKDFNNNSNNKENEAVEQQQAHYLAAQPIPFFEWSFERDLVVKLYELRNKKVATYSVWRSLSGVIEDHCPSIGFGIPYDTSLTNPLTATNMADNGQRRGRGALTSVGKAEPNGIYQSQNTNATWVMCVGDDGNIEPVYVESKVTTYPYMVTVDMDKNRVKRIGKSSVVFSLNEK